MKYKKNDWLLDIKRGLYRLTRFKRNRYNLRFIYKPSDIPCDFLEEDLHNDIYIGQSRLLDLLCN